jgi:putative ABC transport system permease protein
VAAVDPASFPGTLKTTQHIIEGRNLRPNDKNVIVLGVGIAGAGHTTQRDYSRSLKSVHPGDHVKVALITGNTQDYEVVGVYETQFPEADATAYIPSVSIEQTLPFSKNKATAVYVRLDDTAKRSSVESAIRSKYENVTFRTADDLAGAVKDIKGTLAIVNSILKGISFLVAAITIFIITYVDLTNRRKQIGIERAIGIKSSTIVISYVFKAVVYAFIGVGAGLASFLYILVPIVNAHPFKFPIGDVTIDVNLDKLVINGLVLAGVAIVAALIPAYQSVRIRILKAIWG